MKTKRCPVCGEYKPYSEYYKDKSRLDGLYNHCKTCQKAYSRAWTSSHMTLHREYIKKYQENNKEKVAEARKLYQRNRYKNDMEFREKKKAYDRAWKRKHAKTEEQRLSLNSYNRAYYKRYRRVKKGNRK